MIPATKSPSRMHAVIRACSAAAAAATLFAASPAAQAGVTFDVISPHEYELPAGGFDPFNVFVQYSSIQNTNDSYNANGNTVSGDGAQTLSGMSKYVRFWTPSFAPKMGLAWEVIQPVASIRVTSDTNGSQRSGLGDTLTGFAAWYRPIETLTLGVQSFAVLPIGDEDVSDGNWKNLTSLFWDWRLPANLGWTADAGAIFQGERVDGRTPGLGWHTNQRFGWRVAPWAEPFVSFDAEYIDGNDGLNHSWVTDVGGGMMFHTFKNQSIAVRWSQSVDGANHLQTQSLNLRYAYVW